ncbi:hypothetical protein CLU79DRAFT_742296 [Phycomyces nitens]|nr:hypothetical protein CLU79DRAFT_742296 [Phycomyces nitens]
MDSTFNYLHWDTPKLPLVVDTWTYEKLPTYHIPVPTKFVSKADAQRDLKKDHTPIHKPIKRVWAPDPTLSP